MTKQITICEVCETETDDMLKDGWLQLEALSLWYAKIKNESKRLDFVDDSETGEAKHFCSMQCLLTWLEIVITKLT